MEGWRGIDKRMKQARLHRDCITKQSSNQLRVKTTHRGHTHSMNTCADPSEDRNTREGEAGVPLVGAPPSHVRAQKEHRDDEH